MKPPSPRKRTESGMAIVLVLMTAFVGFMVVAGVLALSTQNSRNVWRSVALSRSEAATDAALEATVGRMVWDLHTVGVAGVSNNAVDGIYESFVSSTFSAALANATLDDFSITSLATTNYGEIDWRITAQTEADDPNPVPSRVSLDLRLLDVPVTGFSLCYDVDLEHYPWHDWVVNGPVYCGQTAYFCPDSGAQLTFANQVFAVGGIVHGPHPLDPGAIWNGSVEYLSERNTQSPVMVQPPPPAGSTNRMHWILERPATNDFGTATGNQRFYNKADVVVLVDGSTVTVQKGPKHANGYISSALPSSMYVTNFYDGREAKWAEETVVLDASMVPAWMLSVFGGARPLHPTIYIADIRAWGAAQKFSAVRVENGAVLGDLGFTLATPNPLYVRGNFNTFSPKPALLAGDAITILSDAWYDGDGLLDLYSDPDRQATSTAVNAAVITGIVPAGGGYGSGWVANILRLLENWDSRTLQFNGSLAVLYHSQTAQGVFFHGSYYYRPAQRTFAFTNFFSGLSQTNVPALKMALRQNYQELTPQ